MGVRGEIFSTRLILPNRTYFLNVKENRLGDLYLNIVESKNRETGGFERQSVIVFADDLPAFLGEFDKTLKNLEKIIREQKQGGKKRPRDREENNNGKDRQNEKENYRPKHDYRSADKPAGNTRSRFEGQHTGRQTGKENRRQKWEGRNDDKPAYGKRKEPSGDRKRVVVKKNPAKKGK